MTKKDAKVFALESCIGAFYKALYKPCEKEIEDVDLALRELIDDDGVNPDITEKLQRDLRDLIKNCVGLYAVRVAQTAHKELQERNKHREGTSPSYVEEDL